MLSPIFCMCHIPQSASGLTPAGSETYLETLQAYGCKGRIKSLNLFFFHLFLLKNKTKQKSLNLHDTNGDNLLPFREINQGSQSSV